MTARSPETAQLSAKASASRSPAAVRVLEGGGPAAAEHNVPAKAERPLWHGEAQVEPGDQPVPGRLGHRVEDRILEEQRIAGEEHLGDQALGEGAPEHREVDV